MLIPVGKQTDYQINNYDVKPVFTCRFSIENFSAEKNNKNIDNQVISPREYRLTTVYCTNKSNCKAGKMS